MFSCENCDYLNRMADLESGNPILYGKAILRSDEYYNLWDKNTDLFDVHQINLIYDLFKENIDILKNDFVHRWIKPEELLYATKGKIWDWTSEEEYKMTYEPIKKCGMYFPIFTLPKGLLHNQIGDVEELKRLESLNLYNAYNGNHRIDVIKNNDLYDEVLIIEIPPYCEKSCTGFKYTPIDYKKKNRLTRYKLSNQVELYHLFYLEGEMKMINVDNSNTIADGISKIKVDDFNTAFRILTEFQNALEPPLTRYYKLNGKLPEGIDCRCFNYKDDWSKMYERN